MERTSWAIPARRDVWRTATSLMSGGETPTLPGGRRNDASRICPRIDDRPRGHTLDTPRNRGGSPTLREEAQHRHARGLDTANALRDVRIFDRACGGQTASAFCSNRVGLAGMSGAGRISMVPSLHGLDPAGGSHAALGTERARQGPGDRRLAPPASGAPSANRSSAVSLERPALPRRRERPPDAGDGERLATRGLTRDWSPQAPPGARDVPPWGRRPPGLSWRGQPEVSARPAASATGTRETEREIATTRTGSLDARSDGGRGASP